jgi:hypothetical protein
MVYRYGWHFPEMTKIVDSNIAFAKSVKFMGSRDKAAALDFSGILEEEIESQLKEAAVVSMGTEVSDEDLAHVRCLCDQVIELSEYRAQLYEYLKNRMQVRAGAAAGAHAPSSMRVLHTSASFDSSVLQASESMTPNNAPKMVWLWRHQSCTCPKLVPPSTCVVCRQLRPT